MACPLQDSAHSILICKIEIARAARRIHLPTALAQPLSQPSCRISKPKDQHMRHGGPFKRWTRAQSNLNQLPWKI